MPTSKQETLYIARIFDEILGEHYDSDGECFYVKSILTKRLAQEIGFLTTNYSVRKSLFDLCRHYNPTWKVPDNIIQRNLEWWNLEKHSDIPIYEYVGVDEEEWNDYVRRTSSVY